MSTQCLQLAVSSELGGILQNYIPYGIGWHSIICVTGTYHIGRKQSYIYIYTFTYIDIITLYAYTRSE